jgi:hypothetical protein
MTARSIALAVAMTLPSNTFATWIAAMPIPPAAP